MSYLAIYRRYRPYVFKEVIGQESIVQTLVNQINSDKIGHAYLFCGPRGVGKTTIAKIFARAVNCLNPVDGSACGECENCKKLNEIGDLNIIEMDAASNNGVDSIRTLRENVQFAPVGGKYKVFIIDEVHMLSSGAFNALLKTLEEPPKHAIFILATTESHKIPETILSRCMRFDFKLISTKQIASLIEDIYKDLGKDYEKEAIMEIAKAGRGSVRDALSVADLCVSIGDGKLTYKDVINVTGSTDSTKTIEIVKNIIDSNLGITLSLVNDILESGKSVGLLSKEIVGLVRNLIVVKTCDDAVDILNIPKEINEQLKEIVSRIDNNRLYRMLEILTQIENDIRYSQDPRILFETSIVKATLPETDYNIDAILGRLSSLEREIKELKEKGIVLKQEQPTPVPKVEIVKEKTEKKEEIEKKEEVISEIQGEENIVEEEELGEPKMEEYEGFEPDFFEESLNNNFDETKEEIKKEEPEKKEIFNDSVKVENKPTTITIQKVWGTLLRRSRRENFELYCIIELIHGDLKGESLYIDLGDDKAKIDIIKSYQEYIESVIRPLGVNGLIIADQVVKAENINKLNEFFMGNLKEEK